MKLQDTRSPATITRRAALAGAAVTLGLGARAHAAPPRAAPLNEAEYQQVLRAQAYLNNIRTMRSRFQQISDQGAVAAGTIYLDRPGRMRIVYDPPTPILIVATEGQVYYYDSKLKQVTRTTINDTPAWFLLRDQIRLGGEVTLIKFVNSADTLRVTLVQTDKPDIGDVTLVLSEQPIELRQWTVVDAQKKRVTVTLDNPQWNVSLDPNLFYWTEPRG